MYKAVDKMKVPVARILTWFWLARLARSLHTLMWAIHCYWFYIKSSNQCCGQHDGTAARLQESRAEAGVVAAPRTEAQRIAVRVARPRGRDQLAACRLTLSK